MKLSQHFKKEEWTQILDYENLYWINRDGIIKNKHNRILKYGTDGKKRYFICQLSKNDVRKTHLIHRLIAQAFIPNPENKPCVNHINGIKTDNTIKNLEWVTAQENREHASKNLLFPIGEKNNKTKLTREKVFEIRKLLKEGKLEQRDIAKIYGVNQTSISQINQNKSWNWLK